MKVEKILVLGDERIVVVAEGILAVLDNTLATFFAAYPFEKKLTLMFLGHGFEVVDPSLTIDMEDRLWDRISRTVHSLG